MFRSPAASRAARALRREEAKCSEATQEKKPESLPVEMEAPGNHEKPAATEEIANGRAKVTRSCSLASTAVRRAEIKLAAKEAIAEIKIGLIKTRMETELQALDSRSQSSASASNRTRDRVEKWLDDHPESVALVHSGTRLERRAPAPAGPQGIPSTQRLLSRLATPRELPSFDGDCIEWLHFKNAYEESSKVCQFTDSENLWRIRKALRGDAKEAVTDLLIGNTPPAVVMEALALRFGRADSVVRRTASQLKELKPLPSFYQEELFKFTVKVNNAVATIRALGQNDYLRSPELVSAVTAKLPSTLLSKWTDYAFTNIHNDSSKLELLAAFLKNEANMLATVGLTTVDKAPPEPKKNGAKRANVLATSATSDGDSTTKCKFCEKAGHPLTECRAFKRALRNDRWKCVKKHKLCYGCLTSPRHEKSDCPAPACNIDNCGRAHHPLLHWKTKSRQESSPAPPPPPDDDADADPSDPKVAPVSATTAACDTATSDVILKVLKVKIRGPSGKEVNTYALLDDASSVTLVESELAHELGLQCEKSSPIKFVDAFGIEVYQSAVPNVRAQISGMDKQIYDIKLHKVSKLNLPVQNLSVINNINSEHLSRIKNGVCKERVTPRILIGEDNYFLIAPLEVIHGGKKAPYATRCRLGWCIHGYCGLAHSSDSQVKQTVCFSHAEHLETTREVNELNEIIKHSFDLDSIGISHSRRENSAHTRALQILDDTSRYLGNEWEVGLPFKSEYINMPDSFDHALSRQHTLMRKFSDKVYAARYTKEIDNLLQQGYARELNDLDGNSRQVWYLPHFGVQNQNKPEKLRLVFDAASKVNNSCLNDFLLTGPDLYNSLLGIMFRFREHPIAITGDIKEMFLRIKIRTEDQNVLRFLWQTDLKGPVKTYVMQSLIFGATCSPFIAQYIKNKNALKYEDVYPESVNVIINNHYMDDCVHSTRDVETATKLVGEISEIHKSGGFHIRGWSSNKSEVLKNIPADDLSHSAIHYLNGNSVERTQRTLGLLWNPDEDTFGFQVNLERHGVLNSKDPPTKAKMLSVIMSVYDIHGFLSPFMIKSKVLFQNVHRSGVDWRSPVKPDDHANWLRWLAELQEISQLRIPRWYCTAGAWTPCYPSSPPPPTPAHGNNKASDNAITGTQLHIFCDASIQAYAAAAYWRFTKADGSVNVCLAASKTRVTPLKPVSVPRLELQGALLGARLASTVQKEHKDVTPDKRYFWTDSSTVLQWIRSDPRTYKPYVAHRLGEIDDLTILTEWRYVPTRQNVADIATRDDAPPLRIDDVWFQGPRFLRQPEESWPKDLKNPKSTDNATCEQKTVLVTTNIKKRFSLPDEERFSSWIRLVRATARVLLFVRRCQRKTVQLDATLMLEAERLLIIKSQHDSFANEIACLQSNEALPKNSRLRQLTPYLDEGMLRVGGRVDKAAGVAPAAARPPILDGAHRTARLLVEHYHRRALHGAHELVVNELRQRYWVLRLRPCVRGAGARCPLCRRRRAAPRAQRMADLPAARLQHHRRPFSFTGVDFFGPMDVTVGRSTVKRYGMLFTCLTIRAVHIEITESLSTDAAIMGLCRMAARRGMPSVIYSDNGTNLRGSSTELKKSLQDLNSTRLQENAAVRGVDWHFIPPGAPEMGGAWERMIRTVKTALKVVLKERAPRPETLLTLMAEVEALVNSRPITHVSTDPGYPEALTPNHFLIGTSSTSPLIGKFNDTDLCLRKQWRIAQRMADMFWIRWTREYLPTLLPRQKWNQEHRALQVGDYVLIVENNLERGSWRHGVVSATHAGDDGRVRVVDVRTRTGMLQRPVTRLALLTPCDSSADVLK